MKNNFLRNLSLSLLIVVCLTSMSSCVTQKAFVKDVEIEGQTGKLTGTIQVPSLRKEQTCPTVILLHGLLSNRNDQWMKPLAEDLQKKGIASVRFDFNGHGQSEGKFQDMTINSELDDAKKIFQYTEALPFVDNISIAGHSLGGLIAIVTAGDVGTDNITSVLLMAPAFDIIDGALKGKIVGSTFDPNNIPELIPVSKSFFGRNFVLVAQQFPLQEKIGQYKGPICIVHGNNDKIVSISYSEDFNKVNPNCKLIELDGEDHFYSQDWEKASSEIINFLIETLKK